MFSFDLGIDELVNFMNVQHSHKPKVEDIIFSLEEALYFIKLISSGNHFMTLICVIL